MAGALNTLGKSLLGGALIGGTAGAINETDDPGMGAVIGAGTGALTGAGGALGARLLLRTMPWVGSKLFMNPTSKGAVRRRALAEFEDVLNNDELTTDDLRQRLTTYPHMPMTVTDASGENTLARADISSKVPGQSRNQALALFEERNRLQPARLQDITRRYLTPNLDARATVKTLLDQRTKDAKAGYKPVFYDPDPTTGALTVPKVPQIPGLDPILERLDRVGAFKMADQLAAAEGIPAPQPGQPVTAEQLDLIKRGLGALIESAYSGQNPNKTLGRAYTNLKHEYVGLLDSALPGYADARKNFADYSTSIKAIETGREFDSRKWDSGDLLDYYNALDPSDQDFFRLGMGARVNDAIMNGNQGSASLNRFFSGRGTQNRMSALFATPDDYDNFMKELDKERRLANVSNTIQGNSATQRRLSEEQSRAASDPDTLMEVFHHPAGVTSGLATAAFKMAGYDVNKLDQLTSAELTKMLLNPRLHENMALLDQLDRYQRNQRVKKMLGDFATGAAAAGAAGGSSMFMTEPPAPQEDPDLPPPQGYAEGGLVVQDGIYHRPGRNPNRPLLPGESMWPYDDPGFFNQDEIKRQLQEKRQREVLHAQAERARELIEERDAIKEYFDSMRPAHDEALLRPGMKYDSTEDTIWKPFQHEYYTDQSSGDMVGVNPMMFAAPFGDKAGALGMSTRDWLAGRGFNYGRHLDQVQQAMEQYRKRNKWRAAAGDVGQLALTAPFGGESIAGQMAAGAGMGALDDLLSGYSLDDTLKDSALNAGMIYAGGKALPRVGRFLKDVPEAVRDSARGLLQGFDDLAPVLNQGY